MLEQDYPDLIEAIRRRRLELRLAGHEDSRSGRQYLVFWPASFLRHVVQTIGNLLKNRVDIIARGKRRDDLGDDRGEGGSGIGGLHD